MDAVTRFLYKVSAPRADWTFAPRPFWRSVDWTSSSSRPRDGYIEEAVVYAAGFDEVSIHLLPKVWRLRVRLNDETQGILHELGYVWPSGTRALIFFREEDSELVWGFQPTIFRFDPEGFEPVPSNEFISRVPQHALESETLAMHQALERWQVQLVPVGDTEELASTLTERGIRFSIQR